ncbi:MAG: type III-A CRISPR-associated protein Cas10/Csm1 [Oscillospiraceae bacterium]|nr:type III-A CRISPR-associated protein Cas10/Csm1 [Oscillospiraceae bacterium]
MDKKQLSLIIGSLLHDIGKLLYRYNDGRNHSISGYDFIKQIQAISDEGDILDCIRYHHSSMLKNSEADKSSLCYITYIADNIAAAADRRVKESGDGGFVRDIPAESIFNIINGNNEKMIYSSAVLSDESNINYPHNGNASFSEEFYGRIVDNIRDNLKAIEFSESYINSLLQLLEADLTYIPSSTNMGELRDISLYDHSKLTAAFGSCIYEYLSEKNITDYRDILYDNADKFYDEKAFRIFSLDMSGIQDFIYNISSKGALKGLRSRSFYLELLMENITDELLSRLHLSRANIMYTGGGHTYLILPATARSADVIVDFEKELNSWFADMFGNGLYSASGYYDCSANELKNIPDGSYRNIFSSVSSIISAKKLHRYSANDIAKLNTPKQFDHTRECVICHRSDMLDTGDKCRICSGLEKLSGAIIDSRDMFFAVMKADDPDCSVPLPFGCGLAAYTQSELKEIMHSDSNYIRSYCKNRFYTGYNLSTNLWVGDYAAQRDFEGLINNSDGIQRLAVIRADVDNLGQAFVNGFTETGGGKYETISRTATFSRKLSEFFKLHINSILENGEFQLFTDKSEKKRNAVIVYAGGDDLFIIGGWDDIICFGVDLYNSFKKYSQGTVTVSAGIGIYPDKYPISAMAAHSGQLEDISKSYKNGEKNAVTLFDESGSYSWSELIDKVIGEKLRSLQSYIDNNGVHSKALLYKMLELIRSKEQDNRLNIARFAYLLSRIKPDEEKVSAEQTALYNDFSKNMYRWIQSDEDCRQLVTAIYIYIYMNRESEENI